MKTLNSLFLLLFVMTISQNSIAQNLSMGLSYNTLMHEGYEQVFNKNALGYNLYYSIEDNSKWETTFQAYFEQYQLENPRAEIGLDIITTESDLYSFGMHLCFQRMLRGYEHKVIPFFGLGSGFGYYYGEQSFNRQGATTSSDVGGTVIRLYPQIGVRFMLAERFGIEAFYSSYFNYFVTGVSDSSIETNLFFIQAVGSLNAIYQF